MDGHLRQELRELELLDEITRLRYEGRVSRSVTGLYCRRLIRSLYAWKSDHKDSTYLHPAMKWNKSMGPRVPEAVTYTEWRPSVTENKKRKTTDRRAEDPGDEPKAKQMKVNMDELLKWDRANPAVNSLQENPATRRPMGLIWDSKDYSCRYNAILTILGNMWAEEPLICWVRSHYLSRLMGDFAKH